MSCLDRARAALVRLGVGSIPYSRALGPTARAIGAERERCARVCREIADRDLQESASDSARRCALEIERDDD